MITCWWRPLRAMCSPTAMQLASLSATAGTAKRSRSQDSTGKRFHPGIREGCTTLPVAVSTGPGRERPTPRSRPRPCCSTSSSRVAASRDRAACGPSAITSGTVETSRSSPPGSTTPTRAWLPPRSAATANSSWPPSLSTLRGRPPVEDWVPSSATRPCSTSWATATETLEAAAPSSSASWAREVARPEAMSSRARAASAEVPAALRPGVLISFMYVLTSPSSVRCRQYA